MENNIITHKKTFKIGKFIIYYVFIQIFLFFLGFLIFITSTSNPYTNNFKNEWNNAYISRNLDYLNENIKKYDIIQTNVSSCKKQGFYEEKSNLVFCSNKKKFIFKYDDNINTIIEKKKDLIIKYGIISFIFSIIIMLLLVLTNRVLFTTGKKITNLGTASKDLENLIVEIKEYIDLKGSRLDYRITSLEALALSVIDYEPDFFHRFGTKIKELSILAHRNRLEDIRDRLHILYKEMEKQYFFKRNKFFKALGLEINLLISKYNTSILVFVINVIVFLIINTLILFTLLTINGTNDVNILNTFFNIINIFTFRESGLETNNIYQEGYIIFLQIFSYVLFLIGLKIIVSKK